METGICIAESLCCSLETSTILLISYTPIQMFLELKKGGGGVLCTWVSQACAYFHMQTSLFLHVLKCVYS